MCRFSSAFWWCACSLAYRSCIAASCSAFVACLCFWSLISISFSSSVSYSSSLSCLLDRSSLRSLRASSCRFSAGFSAWLCSSCRSSSFFSWASRSYTNLSWDSAWLKSSSWYFSSSSAFCAASFYSSSAASLSLTCLVSASRLLSLSNPYCSPFCLNSLSNYLYSILYSLSSSIPLFFSSSLRSLCSCCSAYLALILLSSSWASSCDISSSMIRAYFSLSCSCFISKSSWWNFWSFAFLAWRSWRQLTLCNRKSSFVLSMIFYYTANSISYSWLLSSSACSFICSISFILFSFALMASSTPSNSFFN